MSEALPVADLIINRGMKVDERCQMCGLEGESIHHGFLQCHVARQVWAHSGIPQPQFEFQKGTMLNSINYLLNLSSVKRGETNDKRAWPWVLWFIWKGRNDFIFQSISWDLMEILMKAKKEADEWFLAQEVDSEIPEYRGKEHNAVRKSWAPPSGNWLMCNVGLDWHRNSKLLGVAWVVRNHRGVVLVHSRRAFSNVISLDEARVMTLGWAVESMASMHHTKIIFAGDFRDIFSAVQKPCKWPALRRQVEEIKSLLLGVDEFQFKYARTEENRGATIIAQSVTRQGRLRSYVATGPLAWLFELFVNESRYL